MNLASTLTAIGALARADISPAHPVATHHEGSIAAELMMDLGAQIPLRGAKLKWGVKSAI